MYDCADWASKTPLLVRLLSEYESVGLLYRLSDTSQALLGVCSSRSIGAWLSDDIPCSDYFKHYLSICAIVDEVFGASKYSPVILNSAPVEVQRLFAERGIVVYARDEAARMSFLISVNKGNQRQSQPSIRSREPRPWCRKIVELGSRVLLRSDSDRRGLLVSFRHPTIQA